MACELIRVDPDETATVQVTRERLAREGFGAGAAGSGKAALDAVCQEPHG